ncbi:uncharacterized protein LOC108032956 [Drosophila biarmipes]|uniref:uncharacterized protein LOC108032956 n=1 Tax=Drosophila biarmipes TaxID=125945 RepID=UPI0007E5F8C2|nr:uncharacterized protein LOC108032956 [Drosophila biarmipes]
MKNTSGKTVLKEELLSMSLDDYYLKHVKKTNLVPHRSGPHSAPSSHPTPSNENFHFRRTHFFGPAYLAKTQSPTTQLNLRLDNLRRELKDLTVVLDSKGLVGSAQKRLDVITKRLAKVTPLAPRPSPGQDPQSTKDAQVPQATEIAHDCEKTLVLTIGDEVLYDEAYKTDTLWMPVDEGNPN